MQRTADRQKTLATHGALISDERLSMEVLDVSRMNTVEGRVLVHGQDVDTARHVESSLQRSRTNVREGTSLRNTGGTRGFMHAGTNPADLRVTSYQGCRTAMILTPDFLRQAALAAILVTLTLSLQSAGMAAFVFWVNAYFARNPSRIGPVRGGWLVVRITTLMLILQLLEVMLWAYFIDVSVFHRWIWPSIFRQPVSRFSATGMSYFRVLGDYWVQSRALPVC